MHGSIRYTFYQRAYREQEGPTELRTPLFLAGERGRVSLVPGKWVAASALASIATYHVRMVNGRAAASGEKKFDLSEAVARFGDILNREGSFVAIGSRSLFDKSAVGVRQ